MASLLYTVKHCFVQSLSSENNAALFNIEYLLLVTSIHVLLLYLYTYLRKQKTLP